LPSSVPLLKLERSGSGAFDSATGGGIPPPLRKV
jgi:hypothetical protein